MAAWRVALRAGFGQCAKAKSPTPTLGKKSQSFALMNGWFAMRKEGNGGNLPLFEFGTPHAECSASPGWPRENAKKHQRRLHMFAIETSNRLFAAAFSVVLSAAFFAYAIIPASPTLIA
jgi:hypothetical protein